MVVSLIQIHSNEDIKVFNKRQGSDHLYTLLLFTFQTIDKRSIKIGTLSNVGGTFPFVYS